MSSAIESGALLNLTEKQKIKVGQIFNDWFNRVDDERRRRFKDVWARALDNFEGKAAPRIFPWIGASAAFVPLTPAFCDTFQSRLFAAATAQTPIFILDQPTGGSQLLKDETGIDVSTEKYVEWWQRISEWVETTQVKWNDVAEELTYHVVIYGDAYLRTSWVRDEVMDISVDKKGKQVKTSRALFEGVRFDVHHPKDVFTEWDENDPQEARKVGVSFLLDLTELEELKARGDYAKADVDKLKKRMLSEDSDPTARKLQQLGGSNHFKEWESGKFMTPDEFEAELKKKGELTVEAGPGQVRLIRTYARVDLDGDGIPEEVIFDSTEDGKIIPFARYASAVHRQRPLVHYYFSRRPGMAYNRGIPELMFNIQKIINTLVRGELDNVTIQNTNVFVGKKGSGIQEGDKIFPNRLFLLNDPGDLQAVNLGKGGSVRGMELVGFIQSMGQLLVGLTDFSLGQEKRSRTPTGTTRSLIEEGNKRIDRTIDRFRDESRKSWFQTLMLYFEHADVRDLSIIATSDPEEQNDFTLIHAQMSPENFRRMLLVNPQVSSNALNRSSKLQEALAKFAQLDNFYQKLNQIALTVGQSQQAGDPVMGELASQMAVGFHKAWGDVLEQMDEKDQEAFNPDVLIDLVKGVEGAAIPPEGNPGSPADAAQGVLASGADTGPPGAGPAQTVPGGTRSPVDSFGAQSEGGGA